MSVSEPTHPAGWRSPPEQVTQALGICLTADGIAFTFYPARADAPMTHVQVAEATLKLDAARLFMQRGVDYLEAHAAWREIVRQYRRIRGRGEPPRPRCCAGKRPRSCSTPAAAARSRCRTRSSGSPGTRGRCASTPPCLRPITETYGRSLLDLPTNTPFV